MERTILQEKKIPVKGTTKLILMDPEFDQKGTKYEFSGNISSAPLGMLIIRKVHINATEYNIQYDEYEVDVLQAAREEYLNTYMEGKYYPKAVKDKYDLNCETAQFYIETKFGSDIFKTGADDTYAVLTHNKQYYGMILRFFLDEDMFTFEELENRFLKLFNKP